MDRLPPDPYKVLGVSRDAQLLEIRSAYRKLVLKCHPDKVQDPALKAAKQDEFQSVQQAYELLSNERERQNYDDRVRLAELRAQKSKAAEPTGRRDVRQRRTERRAAAAEEALGARRRRDAHAPKASAAVGESSDEDSYRALRRRSGIKNGAPSAQQDPADDARRTSIPFRPGPAPRDHARAQSADESSARPPASGFNSFLRKSNSGRSSPAAPPSPGPADARGSRWDRFRRSPPPPPSQRRSGSRAGSRGSQASARSVGSQVSQEDMDKFDYVLQAMEDLLDKHIKKLRGRFLRNLGGPAKSLKKRCRETLVAFQERVLAQYDRNVAVMDRAGGGGEPRRGGAASPAATPAAAMAEHARYRLLVELFDELRLELADFARHNLSDPGAGGYCQGFCGRIDALGRRLSRCGVEERRASG